MKTVLIPLAEGFEEIEAITLIDVFRRAGLNVTTCALTGNQVSGAHDVKIQADTNIEEISGQNFDAIVLPGGLPGTSNLLESKTLKTMLKKQHESSKCVAAICAAPWVLSEAGILDGKKATIYPGFEEKFSSSTIHSKEKVVRDNNIFTSKGPGTSFEFALSLVEHLVDTNISKQLRDGMLVT